MRHRVSKVKLSRDMDHRRALRRNLALELLDHGKITTTLDKAKFVKPFVEKIITRAREGYTFNEQKVLEGRLNNTTIVKKLLTSIGPSFKGRNGGYTRIVKLGHRDGDRAAMARMELVKEEKKEPLGQSPAKKRASRKVKESK